MYIVTARARTMRILGPVVFGLVFRWCKHTIIWNVLVHSSTTARIVKIPGSDARVARKKGRQGRT